MTDDTEISVGTLPVGEYDYTVSYDDGDYAPQTGKVTVKRSAVTQNITLNLNEHTLTFNGLPEDVELVVKDREGNTVSANEDGSYSVVNGTYSYTAKAFGYDDATGTVTIDRADKEETVAMTLAAGAQVTFENADKGTLTVTTKIDYWTTKTMTGTNGVYTLPFGYTYNWTFTSDSYIDQSGEYTTVEGTNTHTITIQLKAKPTKNTDGYYQIETADQLAWLAQEVNAGRGANYNAVLTANIDLDNQNWTPIGKNSSYAYKGVFDGQGFEVKNLSITGSASNNYGLFGYVNGGTIKNLTVSGSITLTGNGNSSYGAAGIVGYLVGSTSVIENCQNKATITGGQNVGGIVGYISSAKSVTGCVNIGSIIGNNSAGGIVGQLYGAGSVTNCYNCGAVTAKVSKAGGIAGYLNAYSSSYTNSVSNCYSTSEVTGTDSAAIVGKINSTKYSTVTSCYYLEGNAPDTNATAKTDAELKGLAPTLGAAFLPDSKNINNGYPVLVWQIPTSVVTFTVNVDATVTIDGYAGTQGTGNTWMFNLPDGTYNYKVSAYGYEDAIGDVAVSNAAVTVPVTLTKKDTKAITFVVTPDDATVTVTWDDDSREIAPDATGGKTYTLPYGKYQYSVWKQGYARVTKALVVDSSTAASVTVALEESTAWDGAKDISEPTQIEGVYQITSGSELAWFAAKVNGVTGTYNAVLCGDIELNGHAFTPIGTDSEPFSGTFDGQGYTISGLNVSGVEYAGLFGVVKDATIKNIVVKGTVTGTSDAGGIVGYAKSGGTVSIENCGNEATVSGKNAGGIIGHTRTTVTITGCYNAGAITGKKSGSYQGYAAGIAGCGDGSAPKFIVKQCYNIGKITSTDNAGGICAYNSSLSVTISECYNVGIVAGKSSGAIVPGSTHSLTKCFYVDTGVDNNTTATKLSATEMQSGLLEKLGNTSWKIVRGVNGGMPVLKWQTVTAPAGEAKLSDFVMFTAEKNAFSLSGDEIYLPTAELTWEEVDDAESYVISVYRVEQKWTPLTAADKAAFDSATTAVAKLAYVDEDAVIAAMSAADKAELAEIENALAQAQTNVGLTGNLKKELEEVSVATEARAQFIVNNVTNDTLGSYATELECVADLYDVTGTSKDMADIFAAMDEGAYYVAVSAVVDGKVILPAAQPEVGEYYLSVAPYNRMKAVTGLKWNGTKATWDAKDGFVAEQLYRIDLYSIGEENSEPEFCKSVVVGGNYTAVDMSSAFAAQKKYQFTVTAIANSGLSSRESLLSDSLPSGLSNAYDPADQPVNPTDDWIEISSAKQWIELANIEDVPSDGTGSPSKQQVEWSKNYKLTADIDFSGLSAAEQMKTKSIGNVTYPFMGEFDGNGHKITGLTLSNNDSGLFWYVGATGKIHNLTIENANVLFSDNAAVLVHNNKGTIENCAVLNTNITADTGSVLGGMVSRNYGIIRNSYVQGGTLTSNTTTATGHAGFAGSNEEGGLIERCWTSMTVNTTSSHAGGFVGHAQTVLDKNDLSQNIANLIGNCAVSGTVTGSVSVGGLVGLNGGDSDSETGFSVASAINNSRADVTVTGENAVGGLAGKNDGAITGSSATGAVSGTNGMTGGLAGENNGDIYSSHASGAVKGKDHVGGFVGSSTGTVKNSYSLGNVTGTNYVGGFAGSLSAADTAISTGTVTIKGAQTQGYSGGFVGYLSGTLTGVANQITVKNVYGYCPSNMKPVGNTTDFASDSQVAELKGMKRETLTATDEKLFELFGVHLELFTPALDAIGNGTVPYGAKKGTIISLGSVPTGFTVTYTVEVNSYITGGTQLKLAKTNDVKEPVTVKVTVQVTDQAGNSAKKTVTVQLLTQYTDLLHKLAQSYQNTSDEWAAMDMMAYGKLTSAQYTLSTTAKQNIINLLIRDVTKADATVSDYSRAEIVLRSLGIDSTKLHPANSEAVVNNAAMLRSADLTNYYNAPWILLANRQGNVQLTTAQINSLITLLADNAGDDGLFSYTYGSVTYSSPDTAAAALAALQPLVGSNNDACALANKLETSLKNYFAANGTFGNANADAFAIIGFIAAGVNPYEVKETTTGKTLVDALMSWVNSTNTGFLYEGVDDDMATEQGFRALVALEQFNTNDHNAYNIYDFSANRVVAGQATGTGSEEAPKEPEETDEITVTVIIDALGDTWCSETVTVKKGSTVYHAFVKAVEASGVSQSGAASGYVRSMSKNGTTLAEFSRGENSGWLYMVNGMLPTVGLASYPIEDGDTIYWYYTTDWTKDPAASAMLEEELTAEDVIKLINAIGTVTLDSGDAINAARMAYNKLTAEEKAKVTNYDVLLAAEAAYAELLLAEKEKETAATDWQTPYKKTLEEVAKRELAFGDEWLAIALSRSGKTVPAGYYDSVLKAVQAAEGNLSDTKYTEYSRTILALTALGKNPADVGGYDLLAKLADMDKVTYQGINGAIFALIALDSGHYDVPAAPEGAKQTSREALVAYLLDAELPEGGWTLSGDTADVDITAMALQALAGYRSKTEVKNAVDRALDTLSTLQLADGGFGSWGTVNSESCAQVIIALTALGIDPTTDSRFLKHGLSPLDALCAFYADGGFRHSRDGAVDAIATEQALCALTAYYRFTNDLSALYDMADTAVDATPVPPTAPVEDEEEKTSVVVYIAIGAVAVAAAGGLVLVRRRKRD